MQPNITKERLLEAAEAVFAECGFEQASMRAIAKMAQVNLAAAHYHYGSKAGLFQAVFARRISAINSERLDRLGALEGKYGPGPLPLAELLEAFLAPALLHLGQVDESWARFTKLVGRIFLESGAHLEAVLEVVRPIQERFVPAFAACLPHLSATELHWRLQLLLGALCSMLSNPERLVVASGGLCAAHERAIALRELMAFAVGALGAPSTHKNETACMNIEEAHS